MEIDIWFKIKTSFIFGLLNTFWATSMWKIVSRDQAKFKNIIGFQQFKTKMCFRKHPPILQLGVVHVNGLLVVWLWIRIQFNAPNNIPCGIQQLTKMATKVGVYERHFIVLFADWNSLQFCLYNSSINAVTSTTRQVSTLKNDSFCLS